jgi:hypothetical protein
MKHATSQGEIRYTAHVHASDLSKPLDGWYEDPLKVARGSRHTPGTIVLPTGSLARIALKIYKAYG